MSDQLRMPGRIGPAFKKWKWDVIFGGGMILLLGLAAFVQRSSEWSPVGKAKRPPTAGQLRRLAIAMHDYMDQHARLPPAALRGHDGEPLNSWRVLLLPFLGEEDLYRQFNLAEPWNSPANLKLLGKMPDVYANKCRTGPQAQPYQTFFRVFAGKGTAFDEPAGVSVGPAAAGMEGAFPDGAAQTILIIQAAEAVPWTKPETIPYAPGKPLLLLRTGGFWVALGDGSSRFVQAGTSEATIRAAVTRNAGDELGPDW